MYVKRSAPFKHQTLALTPLAKISASADAPSSIGLTASFDLRRAELLSDVIKSDSIKHDAVHKFNDFSHDDAVKKQE